MKMARLLAAFALAAVAPVRAQAQTDYKRELPAALVKKAKVTEAAAATAALARVPNGAIQTVELEEEDGKLIYSYDIKVAGKPGIEEVHVSAITGKVTSAVHETPADEAKEAAADAKKKTAPTKKKP